MVIDPNMVRYEIERFLDKPENRNISYYELVAYAYDNDKHEWIWLLKYYRKHRLHIVMLIKCMMRRNRTKYNYSYPEVMELVSDAVTRYRQRNEPD